jgi:hypothetical protein
VFVCFQSLARCALPRRRASTALNPPVDCPSRARAGACAIVRKRLSTAATVSVSTLSVRAVKYIEPYGHARVDSDQNRLPLTLAERGRMGEQLGIGEPNRLVAAQTGQGVYDYNAGPAHARRMLGGRRPFAPQLTTHLH